MVYLDNSATTKPDKAYLDIFRDVSENAFGNASSLHRLGHEAEQILKSARAKVGTAIGAAPEEIIFTASGSEANNLAIFGAAKRKGRIIISAGEHASVFMSAAELENRGFEIIAVPSPRGIFDLDFFKNALSSNTVLVSVMLVNNETGALNPVAEISALIKNSSAKNALFHVDAVQSLGKIRFSVSKIGCDMLSLSAHKIHAPKGAGALYVRKNLKLVPIIFGGGQEQGLRSGTENVAGIAAFAAAAEDSISNFAENSKKLGALSAYALEKLSQIDGLNIYRAEKSAPHIILAAAGRNKSEVMIHRLEKNDIYLSGGSACNAKKSVKNRVLADFGLPEDELWGALRISLSHHNTADDIDALVAALPEAIK